MTESHHMSFYQAYYGFWLIFVLLMITIYGSNLKAHLVKQDFTKPIETGQDMLDTNHDVVLVKGASFNDVLKNAPNKIWQQLYQRAVERDTIISPVNGRLPEYVEKKFMNNGGKYHLFICIKLLFTHKNTFVYRSNRICCYGRTFSECTREEVWLRSTKAKQKDFFC